ncbi:MAG: hypothetical protein R6X07_11965 [Desulfatiglandales bacterium]
MKKLLLSLENVVLLGMGLYMILLTRSDEYTLFLNPKFRWLTLSAGAGLVVLAVASLLRRTDRADLFRTAAFAVMGGLIFLSGTNLLGKETSDPYSSADEDSGQESHMTRDGISYLKLNTAELVYLLMGKPDEIMDQPIVIRGVLKKSASMDLQGRFALLRVNMVCCVADAMAMGVMVTQDEPVSIGDGRWVKVYGRMKGLTEAVRISERITVDGIPSTVIHEKAVLLADAVEPVSRPRAPYLYELPGEERFDY